MGRHMRSVTTGLTSATVVIGAIVAVAAPQASAIPEPQTSPTAAVTTFQAEPVVNGEGDFAKLLLEAGGWPVTGNNVCAVVTWEIAEGGHFVAGSTTFNPLNTSLAMPGDSVFNSHGVRNYPDWSTGLVATLNTLRLDFYGGIRDALAAGNDAARVLQAVTATPWGTKFPDPAASLAPCADWAAGFDQALTQARAAVDAASANLSAAQAAVARAEAEQASVDAKHAQMSGQIAEARHALGRLARSLYIVGVEPAIASQVDAIGSGDPISYEILRSYPNVVGQRDSGALHRALGLLAEVDTDRKRVGEATAASLAVATAAREKLAQAQGALEAQEIDVDDLN